MKTVLTYSIEIEGDRAWNNRALGIALGVKIQEAVNSVNSAASKGPLKGCQIQRAHLVDVSDSGSEIPLDRQSKILEENPEHVASAPWEMDPRD